MATTTQANILNLNDLLKLITISISPILLLIAILVSLGYMQLAELFIDINIMLVGLYCVTSIHQNTHRLSRPIFLTIVLTIILVDLQNLNYAPLLKLNVFILLIFLSFNRLTNNNKDNQELIYIFSVPFVLTVLDMLGSQTFNLNLFTRNIWDAAFISTGIWLVAKHYLSWMSRHAYKWILLAFLVYALLLLQLPISSSVILMPVKLSGLTLDMGNTLTTSHLSIFAAPILISAIYLFFKKSWLIKIGILPVILITALFILYTSWRPLWLGLGLGVMVAFVLCYPKKWQLILVGMVFVQLILIATNAGHYKDRMFGLWAEKKTEERNIIWRDAWVMQKASPLQKWVFGHGFMSFLEDFREYSTFYNSPQSVELPAASVREKYLLNNTIRASLDNFRFFSTLPAPKVSQITKGEGYFKEAISFSSPHNLLLDLLYTCGFLGLALVGVGFFYLIRYFAKLSNTHAQYQALCCAMIAALICNLVVNGLNFPFFKYFNVLPSAYIFGVLLFVHEHKKQYKLT